MSDISQYSNEEIKKAIDLSRMLREQQAFPGPYQADLALEPGPWRPNFVDPEAEGGEALYILGSERTDDRIDSGFTCKFVQITGEQTISIREMMPVSSKFKLAPAPGGWDRYVLTGRIPFVVQGWGKESPLNYSQHEGHLTPLMEESIVRMAQQSYFEKDDRFYNIHFNNTVFEREMEALRNRMAFHFSRDQLKLDELQVFSLGLTSEPEGEDELIYYDKDIGLSATFPSCEARMRYPSVFVDGEMIKAAKLDYRLRYAVMWYLSSMLRDGTIGTSKNPTSTELVDIVSFAIRMLPREKINGFSRSIFEYIDVVPTGESIARTKVFELLVNMILDNAGTALVNPMKDVICDLVAEKSVDKQFIADQNNLDTLGHGRYKYNSGGSVDMNMFMFGSHMAYDGNCTWCKINPVPDPGANNRKGRIYEGFGIYEINALPAIEPDSNHRVKIAEEPTNDPLAWRPLITPIRTSVFEYERQNPYSKFHSNLLVSIPKSTYLPKKPLSMYNMYWAMTTGNKSCLAGEELVRVEEFPYDVRQRKFVGA